MFERGAESPGVVVVGIDGSEGAWRAAAYALGMARRQHSRLVLVHASVPTTAGVGTVAGPAIQANTALVSRALEAQVLEAIDRAGASLGVDCEFCHLSGGVSTCLARVADELRADAIVVGACRSIGHRLLGSPTRRLERAGRWPIIIVP